MKRKILILLTLLALVLTLLPACEVKADSSIKSISRPYIAQYECVQARYGNKNLLEEYDYIKITLLNKEELEVSFKPKDGEKKSAKCNYTLDPETRILQAEIGILGFKFKESVEVVNGKIVIVKNIGPAALVVVFEAK